MFFPCTHGFSLDTSFLPQSTSKGSLVSLKLPLGVHVNAWPWRPVEGVLRLPPKVDGVGSSKPVLPKKIQWVLTFQTFHISPGRCPVPPTCSH